MKIGIITHPLRSNYGGLLQNYALQQILTNLGHDVYTISRDNMSIYNQKWSVKLIFNIKRAIKKIIGKRYAPSYNEFLYINKNCINFIEQNIRTTKIFYSQKELKEIINKYNFNAYIVGSDQVWRPSYSLNIYNDFLDFCQEKSGIKRIAYAASFGVDEWEFNTHQTRECRRLAKLFDAISVREDSGLKLCKDRLDIEATQVLDPTMLLEKDVYTRLAKNAKEKQFEGDIFCYILDNNAMIQNILEQVENRYSLKCYQVKSKNPNKTLYKNEDLEDHVIPSPTKWIQAFMDAKMVFTDSFHGCVFAIIFNKPFWAIGNKSRGNTRFESLLKLFNLKERIINLEDFNNIQLEKPIDWKIVNKTKEELKNSSILFIKNNLIEIL